MTDHTEGKIQVTAGADLSLFLQPRGGDDIIAHFGGENAFPDARHMMACWNALAGVEDPEAFMRDLRAVYTPKIGFFFGSENNRKILKHLKGGE